VYKNFLPQYILSVDGAIYSQIQHCDGVKKDLVTPSLELVSGINVVVTDSYTLSGIGGGEQQLHSHRHLSSVINATNFLIA
jgi:hypothetical protein